MSNTKIQELVKKAKQKPEDGTAFDLGVVPTGHKKTNNTMHSLCAHDIDEEHNFDDGW